MKQVLIGILIVVGLMVIVWSFGWFGVGYTKTVEKAQQNATTEVFKNSQVYIDGVKSDFEKQRLAYTISKDSVERKAIAMYMITTFSKDQDKLNPDEQSFLYQLKQ